MIHIMYDEKNLTLEVAGHAGYAEPGKDIVCAAVSILYQTLLKNLLKFKKHGWYQLDYDLDTPGECYIHCTVNGYFSFVVEMFRFTMVGLKMIAEYYPKYVEIKEQGGEKDGTV